MLKNTRKLLLFAAMFLAALPAWSQDWEDTRYRGTDARRTAPLDFYYIDEYYCRTQFILHADSLTGVQNSLITHLTFYTSPSTTNKTTTAVIRVRMKYMPECYFENNVFETTGLTTVYIGNATLENGRMTLRLNTSFPYVGHNHLLIEFENLTMGEYIGNSQGWYGKFSSLAEGGTVYPSTLNAQSDTYPVAASSAQANGHTPKVTIGYNSASNVVTNHFHESFNYEPMYWMTPNMSSTNMWKIGNVVNSNYDGGIYVTSNGAFEYENTATNAYAVREVNLKPNKRYAVNFEWQCAGEGNYDYARLALVPSGQLGSFGDGSAAGFSSSAVPSGAIALDGGNALTEGGNSWDIYSGTITTGSNTEWLLTAFWRNDGSTNNSPSAKLDNINITQLFTTPYICTFQLNTDQRSGWNFAENGQANYWTYGSSTALGSSALYVTDEVSYGNYDESSPSKSHAFTALELEAGHYKLSFDWYCQGEHASNGHDYDFGKVCLLPNDAITSIVEGDSPNDGLYSTILCNSPQWNSLCDTIEIEEDGIYYLDFYWENDGSDGGSYPLAVKNISLTKVSVVNYYNVTVNVNDETMGSATGGGQYPAGTEITLTATPNEGYRFVRWEAENGYSTVNPVTITVPEQNVTITAVFAAGTSEGIEQAIDGASISLYPNPADEQLFISADGLKGNISVSIIDLNGRTVSTSRQISDFNGQALNFDITSLTPGTYFVRIEGENGTKTAKFVKK